MTELHRLTRSSLVRLVVDEATHRFGIHSPPRDVVWYGNPQVALHFYLVQASERGLTDPETVVAIGKAVDRWLGEFGIQQGRDEAAPSDLALHLACTILKRVPRCLSVSEIDADALGGITLWLTVDGKERHQTRRAWLECRNSGRLLLILDDTSTEEAPEVRQVEDLGPAFAVINDFLRGSST